MKRTVFSFVTLAAAFALGACNGSITSIGVPAASPWNSIDSVVSSPYDDLTVVAVGSDISASIFASEQYAVCTSDQGGFFAICDDPGCTPPGPAAECVSQAPSGATNVGFDGQLPFVYGMNVALNRPAFTAGGVQLQSVTGGTLGAIAFTIDGGTTLNISAGFSEGLIQGPTVENGTFDFPTEYIDDFSAIVLSPTWPDFGFGYVCTDGTTTSCDPGVSAENVAAVCQNNPDLIAIRTTEATGPVSVLCGSVTVNLNIAPPFESVGQCISTLKQQECSGLKGKDKAACNHAQIGVCHASFNVPSAHNPN